jgi:nucleoside phosphorylase
MKVEAAIITALPNERHAMVQVLERVAVARSQYRGDRGREYDIFTLPVRVPPIVNSPALNPRVRIAIGPITNAGPINATIGTMQMLTDIHPAVTILVGIAACMDEKLGVGDVAVGEYVYDFVLSKADKGEDKPEWVASQCDRDLVRRIRQWLPRSKWLHSLEHSRPDGSQHHPKVDVGTYLSGNVVLADPKKKEELLSKSVNRKTIAVEMEAAGVNAVIEEMHGSFLVMKAFSDYGSDDKSGRAVDKDKWQEYACHVSATFAMEVIVDCIGAGLGAYRDHSDPSNEFSKKATAAVTCFIESYPEAATFFQATARAIFESAAAEIQDLAVTASRRPGERREPAIFKAQLARGYQFLLRARDVFGTACRVMAFSVDGVSTFWLSSDMKDAVKQYIDSQAGGRTRNEDVTRVFVFSSPRTAHDYAKRLDYHAARFPNTFVCSIDHYEHLLRQVFTHNVSESEKWVSRDFALLEYPDNRHRVYLANFVGEDMAVQGITWDVVADGLRVEKVREFFKSVESSCTVPGEVRVADKIPVLKWKIGLWNEIPTWTAALAKMFEQRVSDVFHATGFKVGAGGGYEAFRRALAKVKGALEKSKVEKYGLASKHGVRDIRLTRRVDYGSDTPRDGLTGGKLHYADGELPSDMILMRMSAETDLSNFLADPQHSLLRADVLIEFGKINEKLGGVLAKYGIRKADDINRISGSRAEIAAVYEEIETAADLWRLDLRDDQSIEEQIDAPPRNF